MHALNTLSDVLSAHHLGVCQQFRPSHCHPHPQQHAPSVDHFLSTAGPGCTMLAGSGLAALSLAVL